MSRHVFYAYVDGYDLDTVIERLEEQFDDFLGRRSWKFGNAWLVNQRAQVQGKKEDLPRWDFGINLELPDDTKVQTGWFTDIEDIVVFLRDVSAKIGKEFVGGVSDTKTGDTYDMFFIDAGPIPVERIKRAFGIGTPAEDGRSSSSQTTPGLRPSVSD